MSSRTISLADLKMYPAKVVRARANRLKAVIVQTVKLRGPTLVQEEIENLDPKPVDRSDFKRNWKVMEVDGGARLYNPLIYAGVIVLGRRPGRGVSEPGRRSLEGWVHRKGLDRAYADEQLAAMKSNEKRVASRLEDARWEMKIARAKKLGRTRIAVIRDEMAQARRAKAHLRGQKARRLGKGDRLVAAQKALAFLIARAIKERGLPSRDPLTPAVARLVVELKVEVRKAMEQEGILE